MNFRETNRKIIKDELDKLGKSNNDRKNDFRISLICGLKRRKIRATIKEHLKNLFKKEN